MSEHDEKIPFSITISPKVAELLRDNGIDLVEALNRDPGLKGKLKRGGTGTFTGVDSDRSQSRMEPLTILAAAVLVTSIGGALERMLRVLTRDPVVVTTRRKEAQLDEHGKPIVGQNGQIAYTWTEDQSYVEAKDSNALQFSTGLGPEGFHFSLGLQNEDKSKRVSRE
jgi:hypothetical protein